MKPLIVKVQLSLVPQGEVLVYNEDQSIFYTGLADKAIVEAMAGELKAYFYASIDKKTKKINLDRPADWQNW